MVRPKTRKLEQHLASYQQTCSRLFVKRFCPDACCSKLFQQVVTSLQMRNCDRPDFYRLVAT